MGLVVNSIYLMTSDVLLIRAMQPVPCSLVSRSVDYYGRMCGVVLFKCCCLLHKYSTLDHIQWGQTRLEVHACMDGFHK